MLLASCNKQDEFSQGSFPADGVVRVTTSVSQMQTRAGGETTAYQGRTLGLIMAPFSGNTNYSYDNVQWTANEQAEWTPQKQMLWENPTSTYVIFAYAPYSNEKYTTSSGISEGIYHKISTDQSAADSNGIIKADLVGYAHNTPGVEFIPSRDLVDGKLPITLSHILSKLTVQCSFGNQWDNTDVSIVGVKVINTPTKMIYNYIDQNVSIGYVEDSQIAPISMRNAGSNNWEAIIAPFEVATGTNLVEVALSNGVTYQYTTPGFTFKKGKAYTLNLKIGKDKLEVVQDVTVGDWDKPTLEDDPFAGGGEATTEWETYTLTNIKSFVDAGTLPISNKWYITDAIDATTSLADVKALVNKCGEAGREISIFMPNATAIGYQSFYQCSALISINLPLATAIGGDAFYQCSALTSINLPNATTIENSAIRMCSALTSITLPLATAIGNHAFSSCSALTSIDIPLVTTIGNSAFNNCKALTSIDMPNVIAIADGTFEKCTKLTTLSIATQSGELASFGIKVFINTPTDNIDLSIGGSEAYETNTWRGYTWKSIKQVTAQP